MFNSQRKKWTDLQVVALLELDMQERRVRIVLAREAIRERLQELEYSGDRKQERLGTRDTRRGRL
jgi:hypothetical protein